jgi:hypothetical protein
VTDDIRPEDFEHPPPDPWDRPKIEPAFGDDDDPHVRELRDTHKRDALARLEATNGFFLATYSPDDTISYDIGYREENGSETKDTVVGVVTLLLAAGLHIRESLAAIKEQIPDLDL